ncbi:MAG: hypothetical protein ACAH81_13370 [Actinomycetota bacterium]
MTRRRRIGPLGVSRMLVPFVAIVLAGCGSERGPADPAPTRPEPSLSDGRWLAVIEAAPRADDLDAITERVRDLLGPALVVSPVSCFEGLPERAGDGYVIGAVAGSQEEAELLVEGAGEPALFTAAVTILCTD